MQETAIQAATKSKTLLKYERTISSSSSKTIKIRLLSDSVSL
jgi:hypothetical protein